MAITPNMTLTLPTVSVTLGPLWATQLNSAISLIDSHDHTPGKGVQIVSASLNINTDLNINSQNLNAVTSVRFNDQVNTPSGAFDLRSTYVHNGDLYYNNQSGFPVQITSGSGLNSSGIQTNIYEIVDISANTTIMASDTYILLATQTATSSLTISLPPASSIASGRYYIIKDVNGQANDRPISISPFGSDTIDSLNATYLIQTNYGANTIVCDGLGNWHVI